MFANDIDFEKLKVFDKEWDVYGYGRLLRNQPLTTVDNIRCMVVLFQPHPGVDHADEDRGTGIHSLTFPVWLIQKLAKEGKNPVPQNGETAEQLEEMKGIYAQV